MANYYFVTEAVGMVGRLHIPKSLCFKISLSKEVPVLKYFLPKEVLENYSVCLFGAGGSVLIVLG